MPAILGFLLLCGAVAGCTIYFIIVYMNKKENNVVDHLQNQKSVLSSIHAQAIQSGNKNLSTAKISKVFLMEKFNLKPKQLKKIIGSLKSKQLVEEKQDSVSITSFGEKYDNIFGK